MSEFTGKVDGIIFENNENLFKILDVEIIGSLKDYSKDTIRVTGNFGDIQISGTYNFTGNLVMHNKFGLQFRVESYRQVMPHEESSLTKYLSSDKFPGIGHKSATVIIDELGLNALEVLKENPAKIDTLSLSKKQKDSLLQGIQAMDSYSEIVLKLAQYGLNKKVANQFYKIYKGDTLAKLEENPYALVANVSGYNFNSADKLGKSLEIPLDDPRRIKGAVLQVLTENLAVEGNTYVDLKELLAKAAELLGSNDFDAIAAGINDLQHENKIVVDDETAALQNIFETENEIANLLKQLIDRHQEESKYSEKEVTKAIEKAEKELDISYDETQKLAIKNALTNPISILTGGPGTGKTTIVNGILKALRILAEIPKSALFSEDPPFLLAAPTGRAAKRMSEITGVAAKTIHRLLGIGIDGSGEEELNTLNGEILIVDEMSMVDMFLFKKLIASIDSTTHVVFVGDKDQLPSVGAGNVFSDLIDSNIFPTTQLKQIHRQGDESTIITLAHDINEGKNQDNLFKKTDNYSFISCQPNLMGDAISQIVKLALKRGFDKEDIQILSPMYHGNGGVIKLNDVVQEIMNPSKVNSKKIETHNEILRIGDRVLQLQNNPEKDIYNGQIGKVISINENNPKECLVAKFDDREVTFSKNDLHDLTRAYAITIHKSQGSEFPLVILTLTKQNSIMLKRNLLYTAITRAENNLVLLGEPEAYVKALNTPGNDRKTDLTRKLCEKLQVKPLNKNNKQTEIKHEDYVLTQDLIYSGEIDPMIGMDNIHLEKN